MTVSNKEKKYRILQSDSNKPTNTPTAEEVRLFYNLLYDNATCVSREESKMLVLENMPETVITIEELRKALNNSHYWKAAGVDQIHTFWYKRFKCTHTKLVAHINKFIKQ